jgi:predicted ArsR family transcriptional regulator
MDRRIPRGVRAERHRLLGNPHRLAIVEALEEAPRQIPELARLLGIHPTTVRDHLAKLLEAGVLQEEPGVPAGRGRPSKRYRLRYPLVGKDTEVRLFIGSLISLLRTAYGERAVVAAEEEGARRGRELGRSFRHPSLEQAVRVVIETLERLSFAPTPPTHRDGGVAVDVRHCPFNVDPHDPDAALVCAFHEGLIRGVAEVAAGEEVGVRLLPFVAPGLCRVEISPGRAQAPDPRKSVVQADPNRGTEDDPDALRDAPRPRRTRRQP